ncbi:uncharacterized protein LOC127839741 [Dreissena polymorpha]|uniref:uncharacterized protein LOC127839741 n=1 Tax=Dreissena polymorpha TaxID=45954 RepID=UPI00226410D2|nr:uncharacterized protein LOC127839741 [Dreissena polymorpha]
MADMGSRPATPRTPVRMVQVNFDPPHVLTSVPGIGPKLAKAIVNLRENAGNVYPESLGILMRRPLDEEVMQMLDFRPNPRLFAITLDEDEEDMGRLYTGELVPHGGWGLGAPRNRPDARERAALTAEINTLEESISELQSQLQNWSQPLVQRSLPIPVQHQLAGPDQISTPSPSSRPRPFLSLQTLSQTPIPRYLSHTPAGRREQKLPWGRADSEAGLRWRSPVAYKTEEPSPTYPSRMHQGAFGGKIETSLPQATLMKALQELPNPPTTSTPYFIYPNHGSVLSNQVPINQPVYNQPANPVPNQPVQNQPAYQVPNNQPSMYNQPATLVPINQPVQNQPAYQVPNNQPSMYNQPATLVPINQPVQNQPANPVPINPPSLPNQQATLALINPPVIPSLPIALLPATTPNPATRDVITRIPKTLQFDGRSNWPVFRGKFERYANLHQWSDDECADGLVWCLVGKAADFYAVLTDGRKTVPYKELLHRLEERFDAKELPATAQGRFQAISQGVGESLDEWSDRVLTLATKAFRDLPQVYATEQAVAKFCHGLQDRETGRQFHLTVLGQVEQMVGNEQAPFQGTLQTKDTIPNVRGCLMEVEVAEGGIKGLTPTEGASEGEGIILSSIEGIPTSRR